MARIGTFSATDDGYVGTIRTMTINVKTKFVLNEKKDSDKSPDYRIFAGGAELGAAWRQEGKGEDAKPFLNVQLDDPSFAAPIRAAFFENEEGEGGVLVWSRKNSR